jgi:aminocarboxymuconate-semialdehyde decarboxylase
MAVMSLARRLAELRPGLVDVHTHAIDPDLPDLAATHPGRFPWVRRLDEARAQIMLDGRVYRDIDSRCWSPARRVADMDAEGVGAQVISAIPVTLCHGEPAGGAAALARAQNDFFARMVDEAPDRLVALGCVPLQDVDLAIAELRRCVEVLGFAGVEIATSVGERELADPAFAPFFQAAAELDAVVFLHPVDQVTDPRLAALGLGFGLGMTTQTATAAAGLLMSDLIERLPRLRLCLAHAGGTLPAALPRLAVGQRLGGATDPAGLATARARALWCDSLSYDEHSLVLAAQRFGAAHVVLGTDYPFAARESPAGDVLTRAAELLPGAAGIARANPLTLLAGPGR